MTTPGSVETTPTAGLEGNEAIRETQESPRDITSREQVDGLVSQVDDSLNQHRESGERSVENIASIGTNLDGDPQDIANIQAEVKKVGLDGEASAKANLINNLKQIRNQSQHSGENPYADDEVHPDVNWDDDSGEIDEGDKSLALDNKTGEAESTDNDAELRNLLESILLNDQIGSIDANAGSDPAGEDDPDSSEKEKTREEVEQLADSLVAASPYKGERKEGGSVFLPNDENTDRFVGLLKKVMELEAEGKMESNVILLPRPATLDIGTKFKAFYDESFITEGSDGKLIVNFSGHVEVESEPDSSDSLDEADSSRVQSEKPTGRGRETEEMFADRVRRFNLFIKERNERIEREDLAIKSIVVNLEKASAYLEKANGEADDNPEKQALLKLGPALRLLNESFGNKLELAKELFFYVGNFAREADGSISGATLSEIFMAQKMISNRERVKDPRFREALGKIGALDGIASPDGKDKAGSESLANLLNYLAKNSEGVLDNDSKQNNEPEDMPAESDDLGGDESVNADSVASEEGQPIVEDGAIEQNIDKEMADVAGGERPIIEADDSATTVKADVEDSSSENPYTDPEVYSDVNWDDNSGEVDVADREIAQSDQSASPENKPDSSS
jgi:hypothetical protein